MPPRNILWTAAAILFLGATVWINYTVKVDLQSGGKDGETQELGKIKVGQPAPDFSTLNLAGKSEGLLDYRGRKVVLIDFWATWCGPCRMSMPELQSFEDDFKDKGFEILSVNQGESADQAGAFMKKKGYGFHVLLDKTSAVGNQYGVRGIPTVVVVDRKGVVRGIHVGYRPKNPELRQLIEQLTKE